MGLIAHYKLDGNADDSGPYEINGNSNNVSWVNGKIGQAGDFNGSSSYINLENNFWKEVFNNNVGQNYTISAWIKPSSFYDHMAVVSQRHGDAMSFGIWDTGKIYLEIDDTKDYNGSNTSVSLNKWNHILVRFFNNKEDSYCEYFLNGKYDGKESNKWDGSGQSAVDDLWIGWQSRDNYGRNPNHFDGLIDDVKIFNHALSDAEIKELSQAKVLHYEFDDNREEATENILDGDYSETNSITNDSHTYLSCETPVEGDTIYSVSLNIENFDSLDRVRIRQGDPNWVRADAMEKTGINKWEGTITTQPETTTLRFLIYGNNATFKVWDKQIEKKSHSTPFVDGTREGTIIKDSTRYNNHGSVNLSTSPVITEGKIGRSAMKFDGTKRIDISNNLVIRALENKSYSAWVKLDSSWNKEGIIFAGKRSTTNSFGVNSNKTLFAAEDDFRISTSKSLNTEEWYHVTYSFETDGSDYAKQKLFINGELEATKETNSYADSYSNSNNYIGYDARFEYYFNGLIDDVRIYKTTLSDNEIKELYNLGSKKITINKDLTDQSLSMKTLSIADEDPSGGSHAGGYGLRFEVSEPLEIKSCEIRPYFTGKLTIVLHDNDTEDLIDKITVYAKEGSVQRVPLKFKVEPGINYWMGRENASDKPLMRTNTKTMDYTRGHFTFPSGSTLGGGTADRYYYFFNLKYRLDSEKSNLKSMITK